MQITGIIFISLLYYYIVVSTPCPSQSSAPYELIHIDDSTTELTGSITLKCRDGCRAEEVGISEINFFLNCSSGTNCPSLRERGGITVVAVGRDGIRFNFTREYDGYYTCGKRGGDTRTANYTMSPPKALVCKWIYNLL
jgi:hypothetical protein